MAGSPEYLGLLDRILENSPFDPAERDMTASWDNVERAWKRTVASTNAEHLIGLAQACFRRIAATRAVPLTIVIAEAHTLHVAKNAGYAGANNPDPWANFRLASLFGISPFKGVLIRMSDKWSRIVSLRQDPNNERVGESILDTLMDLAAYSLIAVCLRWEEQNYPALDAISSKPDLLQIGIDGTEIPVSAITPSEAT